MKNSNLKVNGWEIINCDNNKKFISAEKLILKNINSILKKNKIKINLNSIHDLEKYKSWID